MAKLQNYKENYKKFVTSKCTHNTVVLGKDINRHDSKEQRETQFTLDYQLKPLYGSGYIQIVMEDVVPSSMKPSQWYDIIHSTYDIYHSLN